MTAPFEREVIADPIRRRRGVAGLGAWVFVLALVVVLGRVVQLQSFPGDALRETVSAHESSAGVPGARGDVWDRRGRPLAMSEFGRRVFVDPARFPDPPEEALARLSELVGRPVGEVAERLMPKVAENARRKAGGASEDELIRYVSIGDVLEDWRADLVAQSGLSGVHLELRPVRTVFYEDTLAPLVGKVGIDGDGLVGLERALDGTLAASSGRMRYVRDAGARPLWLEPGQFRAPARGQDVRLSIDLELQRIAREELERGIERCDAAGGRMIIADPTTGEILAMVDLVRRPADAIDFDWDDPNKALPDGRQPRYVTIRENPAGQRERALARVRCVEDVYEPGSSFKPFMWAVATELGAATPDEVIDTEGGSWRTPYGRAINDVTRRDEMTWHDVLVNSSNIGMVKVTSELTPEQLHAAIERFGFGSPTRIGLPGESPGIVTSLKDWTKYTHTSVAFGHEVAVTPLQMVRAFSSLARDGKYAGTLPRLRLTAAPSVEEANLVLERVLDERLTMLTREALAGVAAKLDKNMAAFDPEGPEPRYPMFGKSGTADVPIGKGPEGKKLPRGHPGYFQGQYISSFIAGAPIERPRIVVLAIIDDPGPETIRKRRHYGSPTAGPVVRRVMERALPYLGVEPDEPAAPVGKGTLASRR